MAKYFADLNHLMPMFELEATTLEEAKCEADKMISYNGQNAVLYESIGGGVIYDMVAERKWYGTKFEGSEDEMQVLGILDFGDAGYYDGWEDAI